MDRRRFLRLLGGAVVTAAPVIHVLPPLGGWRPHKVYSFNSGYFLLRTVYRDLPPVPANADLAIYYQWYEAFIDRLEEPMRRMLAEHPGFERLLLL
jgi:hypothetical protein